MSDAYTLAKDAARYVEGLIYEAEEEGCRAGLVRAIAIIHQLVWPYGEKGIKCSFMATDAIDAIKKALRIMEGTEEGASDASS